MQFLKNTLLALSAGYVLFFFSERLFWSAFKPGDSVPVLLLTWVVYSAAAYLFLSLVAWLRAYATHRVFLTGAVFGWLVEGTLVGTLYGTESSAPFPLGILVTGVSWHALISVWVGWHFLRRGLAEGGAWRTVAWSAGLGLFWGTWATFLWRETPPVVVSVAAFATHAAATTVLLGASYWLAIANLACLLLMPLVATAAYALWMNVPWWRRVPVPVIVFYGITAPASAVVLAWAVWRSFARRHPLPAPPPPVLGAADPPPAGA